jgi:DMATS type aromatic prenyltransferase
VVLDWPLDVYRLASRTESRKEVSMAHDSSTHDVVGFEETRPGSSIDEARAGLPALSMAVGPCLAELGTRQLEALAEAWPAFAAQTPTMTRLFSLLLGSAGVERSGSAPAFACDVVDDQTPYELSFTLGGRAPEVRLLVETPGKDGSLPARWTAALAMGERLRSEHGASLKRFDAIADLFEPKGTGGLFAAWHAAAFRPGAQPELKVYLDLHVRGREHAGAVLEEALARLGMGAAYVAFLREAGARGPRLDEPRYLSLDLAEHGRARVKAYLRHHHATAADAERVVGTRGGAVLGETRAFCAATLGGEGPYDARPLVSCWSFEQTAEPTGATLYAPIAYYVHDDAEARARVHRWLERVGIDGAPYDAALLAFARRPLASGVGMHSYVSYKRERGVPKATVYLAPEAYRVFPPGSLAHKPRFPAQPLPSPVAMVERLERRERIADHPLFNRLAREEPAVGPLWVILANNWVGIGDAFPRWLSSLVSRVEDDAMRTFLAKQLNDELGDGDPSRAHRVLFQRMLADLEPFAPEGDHERWLAPGRRLAERLARHYLERPVLEAVGGTLVMEVFGKQVDQRIGDLMRRQTEVDTASLSWLVLHETLEEEHVDESVAIARLVPADAAAQAAVSRGAEDLANLGFSYLDEIYEVLFR